MLEEIVGMILSVFSLFLNETPRLSRREQPYETDESSERRLIDEDKWLPYINKEYDDFNNEDELTSPLPELTRERLTDYRRLISDVSPEIVSYRESIRRSFWTSLSITIAVVPLTAITMVFQYLDLKTTDLCIEWQYHNHSLPLSVKRIKLIGVSVEVLIVNLWFPLTTALLFSWKVFKLKYFSTFYVGVIFGLLIVIYDLFLLVFGVYGTQRYYMYPANILNVTAKIICGIVLMRSIRAHDHEQTISYSNLHIMILVSLEFVLGSFLAYFYRYAVVPFFNSVKNEDYKFLIAAMFPVIIIIPVVILKHIASRKSSEIIHPGRSFILVYCIRGGVIYLYRTMQADFTNIWLFVGLSLFSGVLNLLKKATYRIRMKLWSYIISRLRRTVCCQRLHEIPRDTPHYRRLRADLEIQDMLFEYITLVVSQGTLVLYIVESFKLSVSSIIYETLRNVVIGIGIDFFFNVLSNFVQIHYYNIPISRVWSKYWKRHMLANVIILMVIVSYFSPVLLSVFQARFNGTGPTGARNGILTDKNCSLF
ncbi:uncharacterized protein LOC114522876 [Dendronephthya gigantea]|uniref:uncharacterized protein LOC114522876 n=1 Tax=Dendronephthya gigantea TaxID=151771 RepID=UPI001068FF1B|nr:uncharacterized protein LOC114522876 [Dendronephthya gigantea]